MYHIPFSCELQTKTNAQKILIKVKESKNRKEILKTINRFHQFNRSLMQTCKNISFNHKYI